MPFVSAGLLIAARDLLLECGADGVVPRSPKGLEPLHAIYRRETCLPAAREALDAGRLRVVSFFPQVHVRIMTIDEVAVHDPGFRAFININTAEDLSRAESLATESDDHRDDNNGG